MPLAVLALACVCGDGGLLVNLGSCGSAAPGWAMRKLSCIGSLLWSARDVIAAFVQEPAADDACVGPVESLKLAVSTGRGRAKVQVCVGIGDKKAVVVELCVVLVVGGGRGGVGSDQTVPTVVLHALGSCVVRAGGGTASDWPNP